MLSSAPLLAGSAPGQVCCRGAGHWKRQLGLGGSAWHLPVPRSHFPLGSWCAPPSSPALLPLPPPTPTALSPEHKAASVQSIGVDNPGWGHIPGTSPDRPGGLALRTPTWALITTAVRPPSGLTFHRSPDEGLAGVGSSGRRRKWTLECRSAPYPYTQHRAPHPGQPAPPLPLPPGVS